jgi:hypothetical protein
LDNWVGSVEGRNPNDQVGEDDQDQKDRSNTVQNLCEVTSSAGSLVYESSGTTDESVVTSGCDDHEGLTTLNTGRSITLVTLMFVDCKGLASNGRLIDLEESIIGNNAAICGNNGTLHKFLLVLAHLHFFWRH